MDTVITMDTLLAMGIVATILWWGLVVAPLFLPLGMRPPGTGYRKARAKQLKREQRKIRMMPYQR